MDGWSWESFLEKVRSEQRLTRKRKGADGPRRWELQQRLEFCENILHSKTNVWSPAAGRKESSQATVQL